MLGKKHTEETKEKISKAKDNIKRKIICVETGIIYESGAEAAKKTDIDISSINHCCKGDYLSAGGYT